MSDVGTRKLFENDRVIVWDFILEPGETSTVHTHTRDYVFCVVEAGGGEELLDANGTFLGAGKINADETHYVELQGAELVSSDRAARKARISRRTSASFDMKTKWLAPGKLITRAECTAARIAFSCFRVSASKADE